MEATVCGVLAPVIPISFSLAKSAFTVRGRAQVVPHSRTKGERERERERSNNKSQCEPYREDRGGMVVWHYHYRHTHTNNAHLTHLGMMEQDLDGTQE